MSAVETIGEAPTLLAALLVARVDLRVDMVYDEGG